MENITKEVENKLKEIQEHRANIRKEYSAINKLEGDIIQLMIENDLKDIEVDNRIYELMWVYDKKIDYELLEREYPEIYRLGLYTSFSKKLLYNSIDKSKADAIIRECTTLAPHYELKRVDKK